MSAVLLTVTIVAALIVLAVLGAIAWWIVALIVVSAASICFLFAIVGAYLFALLLSYVDRIDDEYMRGVRHG